MNILASLINIFEKSNNAISKRLLKDINAIRNGTYIDEGMLIEDSAAKSSDKKDKSENQSQSSESVDFIEKGFITQTPENDSKVDRLKQVLKTKLISESKL
jgi:hypothetical protein